MTDMRLPELCKFLSNVAPSRVPYVVEKPSCVQTEVVGLRERIKLLSRQRVQEISQERIDSNAVVGSSVSRMRIEQVYCRQLFDLMNPQELARLTEAG